MKKKKSGTQNKIKRILGMTLEKGYLTKKTFLLSQGLPRVNETINQPNFSDNRKPSFNEPGSTIESMD